MNSVNARIRRVFQLGRSARPAGEFRNQCSFRPEVESLETRSLPSASPLSLNASLIGALVEPASHVAAARVEVEFHASAEHSNGRMVGQSFTLELIVGPSRDSMSATASIGSRPIGAPPAIAPPSVAPPAIEVVGKSAASTPPAGVFAPPQTASSPGFGDFIPVVNAANSAAVSNVVLPGTSTGANTPAPVVQNSANPLEFSGSGRFSAGSNPSDEDWQEELEAPPAANRPAENNSAQEHAARSSIGQDVEVSANTAWFVQQDLTDDDMGDPGAPGDPTEANDPAVTLDLTARGAALAAGLGLFAVRTTSDNPTRTGARRPKRLRGQP